MVDPPQTGSISLGECRLISKYLADKYGVTDLLPKTCNGMIKEAEERHAPDAHDEGYIRTYKQLIQETEKWPILWD